jgi:hypothetical protein
MDNTNQNIINDFRVLILRMDVLRAEINSLNSDNRILKKTFLELLEVYQFELSRRDSSFHDNTSVDYHWLAKAGILD